MTDLSFNFLVEKIFEDSQVPKRASEEAAGFDVCAYLDNEFFEKNKTNFGLIDPDSFIFDKTTCIIPAGGKLMIPTGFKMAITPGYYGQLAPRSGLTLKYGIHVGAGVIDSDYRGQVQVILFNFGPLPFKFKHGERIAQLIIKQIVQQEAKVVDKLPVSVRGSDGFGSTGK